MPKKRLDVLMVEKGLVDSRSLAQRMVMAGQVRVDGELILKSSSRFDAGSQISLEKGPRFVSRGGEKLAAAFEAFDLSASEKTCADVGASTGGFTDCLLQYGARLVYAIDVGKGILHWKIRQRKDVIVMEKTNARYVESLPEPVQLVTIDASFISLKTLLPVVLNWLPGSGDIIALIKPQFEAGRKEVSRGDGVIRNAEVHQSVLEHILSASQEMGLGVKGLVRSPLVGPKGNVEFLAWLTFPGEPGDFHEMIQAVMIE
ncbi:MAG TPA: TlyA family RNA methyltransferase [Anaerolineales bacterium]|nr:TlyA family RNA methyltransferase [Anaerolineales bacterium]